MGLIRYRDGVFSRATAPDALRIPKDELPTPAMKPDKDQTVNEPRNPLAA